MKNISVLGSTGSIGVQTLEIVREKNTELNVCALACAHNVRLAEAQIREFKPDLFAMFDETAAQELAGRVADLDVRVVSGMDGLLEAAG